MGKIQYKDELTVFNKEYELSEALNDILKESEKSRLEKLEKNRENRKEKNISNIIFFIFHISF